MYRLSPILRSMGACQDSLDWLAGEQHPTFHVMIKHCTRVDWLLWLAGRTLPQRPIVLLACDLAEPALRYPKESHAPARALLSQVRQMTEDGASREDFLGLLTVEWNLARATADHTDIHSYEAVLAVWRAASGAFGAAAAQAAHVARCASDYAYANSGCLDAHAAHHAAVAWSLARVRDQIDWFAVECQLVEIGRTWCVLAEVPG